MTKDTILLLAALLIFVGVFYAYNHRNKQVKKQPKMALMVTTCAVILGVFVWYSFSDTPVVKESVVSVPSASLLTESFPSSLSDTSLSI